jgi:hypothetical protein
VSGAALAYVLAPLVAWVAAGSLKFVVNSLRRRGLAWDQVGYGGWPSTHAAIVGSTVMFIALRQGWGSPEVGVAVTVGLIVVLDATGLRRHVSEHATMLRRLQGHDAPPALKTRLAHTWGEVLAGLVVGGVCAIALDWTLR